MSLSSREMWQEFSGNKIGLVGIGIIILLFAMSAVAAVTIPVETFKEWNNPASWITFPKSSLPAWVNYFLSEKIPEHKILKNPQTASQTVGEVSIISHGFVVDYEYDSFPSDFIYEYTARYTGTPLLQISVIRPDGVELQLTSTSLPKSVTETSYHELIFSTDDSVKKNLRKNAEHFAFPLDLLSAEDVVFSATDTNKVLKGRYVFQVNLYSIDSHTSIKDSKFILGGKIYGLIGTDELRRDLAVGLLWGTPLALFIGISVAVGSVVIGLIYGVFAGYKGKKTDEALMRFNDVIYAMPALPLLIILAVTIGNSIFLIVGFLMIFGWVGIAKVSRSMAMQIKTLQYVEAAKIMGQKDIKVIFKHILPQLLPYTFASIAISVPAAITTEAGLSFLGLGDPTFPTWGQILHDANTFGAASRGLWWWIVPPGVMIALTGLAFVFIGNAMDTIVNPKLKR
ncbi:MAG: ABC transporter permease [Nitrosopumilaceae archaeon]